MKCMKFANYNLMTIDTVPVMWLWYRCQTAAIKIGETVA